MHGRPHPARPWQIGVLAAWLATPGAAGAQGNGPATVGSVESCARCHTDEKGPMMETPRLVRHDEYAIWKREDRHSRAFEVLKDPTSRAIVGRLGWGKEATAEGRCLSCHGTDRSLDPESRKLALERPAEGLDAEGVSCVACHGSRREWISNHVLFRSADWMKLTAAEKAAYGMNDLRDPARRAQICLSCHIGNPAEGKDLTHEMYAAGHPPLGGIEVEAFSQAMARHWDEPKAIDSIKQAKRAVQKDGYHYDPEEASRARRVATAGVAKFLEATRAMNQWADAARSGADGRPGALDFARFDCAACHHDLQAAEGSSWRQRRGFPAGAGRPPVTDWPEALARAGIGASGDESEWARVQHARAEFVRAAGRRPFGDPARLASASEALARETSPFLATLGAAKFDRESAATLLKRIVDRSSTAPPDFESARQLAWAFWAVATELDERFAANPEALRIAKTLDAELVLNLFAARPIEARPTAADRLARAAAYDPARFRDQIAGLAAQLPR